MEIQLTWIDPNTEERREPLLETPVAIGREFAEMPQKYNYGERVSRVVIKDDLIADYHALIDWKNQELIIIDQNTNNGIKINGIQMNEGVITNGDRIQIGSCEIVVGFSETAWKCDRLVGFLFKRRCSRTDNIDCPDCNETYASDYAYYSGYGYYSSGHWGSNYYHNRDRYSYDPETGNIDFTEADATSLENERDEDFEQDMGGS